MTTELTAMIHDLIRALRDAGIDVPTDTARQVEVKIRMQYGGERVYVASLPKQRRAAQIAKLNLRTSREIATASGLPLRTVQRLRSGR